MCPLYAFRDAVFFAYFETIIAFLHVYAGASVEIGLCFMVNPDRIDAI